LDLATLEACRPALDRGRGRVDPPTRNLARVGVQSVECDLSAVHVKASYDRHLGAAFEFRHYQFTRVSRVEPREALFMPSFAGAKQKPGRRWRRQLLFVHSSSLARLRRAVPTLVRPAVESLVFPTVRLGCTHSTAPARHNSVARHPLTAVLPMRTFNSLRGKPIRRKVGRSWSW